MSSKGNVSTTNADPAPVPEGALDTASRVQP